jgi:hypothetical protein
MTYPGPLPPLVAERPPPDRPCAKRACPIRCLPCARALRNNLEAMAAWSARAGVALAPHGKTAMSPELAARQLAHGRHPAPAPGRAAAAGGVEIGHAGGEAEVAAFDRAIIAVYHGGWYHRPLGKNDSSERAVVQSLKEKNLPRGGNRASRVTTERS